MRCSLSLATTTKYTCCEVRCWECVSAWQKANHVSFMWEILIILNGASIKSGHKQRGQKPHRTHVTIPVYSPSPGLLWRHYQLLVIPKPGKLKSQERKKAKHLWRKRGWVTGNPLRLKRTLPKFVIPRKEAVNILTRSMGCTWNKVNSVTFSTPMTSSMETSKVCNFKIWAPTKWAKYQWNVSFSALFFNCVFN